MNERYEQYLEVLDKLQEIEQFNRAIDSSAGEQGIPPGMRRRYDGGLYWPSSDDG